MKITLLFVLLLDIQAGLKVLGFQQMKKLVPCVIG